MAERTKIAVVDDDESVRESLPDLLASFGFEASPFASAEDFLASGTIGDVDCLILDVAMPGMSGPELQRELGRMGHATPIVFITAHSDEKVWPALLGSGAVACLLKPFSEDAMLGAVWRALNRG
ncbi:MAG: two-component system response regulator [Sphingomonas hengshuiensis]|nr:MAG: two-component system response regulator [Sphingomonas hengshuiensis]